MGLREAFLGRHWRLLTAVSAMVISTLGAFNAFAAEKSWHLVRGGELKRIFGNQELGDGVHFAYQFEVGGG